MPCWRDKIIEECSGQKNHVNKYVELGAKPLKTLKVLEIKLAKKNVPHSEISNKLAVGKCLIYESQIWFQKVCKGGMPFFFFFWATVTEKSYKLLTLSFWFKANYMGAFDIVDVM